MPVKAIVRISDTMVFDIYYDPENVLQSVITVNDEVNGLKQTFTINLE